MSVKGIRDVIRRHTGTNANDNVKITHQEVVIMIRSAEDHGRPNVGERLEIMAALEMFGGDDIEPGIFSSQEDKTALMETAMKGIETGERFEGALAARTGQVHLRMSDH